MNPTRLTPVLIAFSAVLATHARAVVVASYNFNTDFSSSDTDLLSTATVITPGTGAGQALSSTDSATQFMTISSNVSTNSLNAAVTNNVSYSFTVTPVSGATLSFTDIAGLVRKSATSSTRGFRLTYTQGATGPTFLAEDSSVSASRAGAFENFSPDSGSLNLSGVAALQNVTTATTFTVFVNPGSSGSDGRTVDFDNIVLNANVLLNTNVVPEPSSALLLGLGALALFRRKR